MIKPIKHREDFNFYLFFDVETTPTYFISDEDKNVEQSKIISFEEYEKFRNDNDCHKEKIHDIGQYHTTKLISVIDQNNYCNVFLVDDEFTKTDLKCLKTKYFNAKLYYCDTPEELIQNFWILVESCLKKYCNVRLFAHNVGFDSKQVDLFSYIKDKTITSACLSKPFFMKLKVDEKLSLSIDDSYSFFSKGLKELGIDIGINKLDFEFDGRDLIIDDKCVEYCCVDSYIIKTAICNLKKYLSDNKMGVLGTTLSSTCMNIWRTKFLSYPIENEYLNSTNPEEIIKIERKSYFGGRTECLRLGMYKNIYYHDINSLYPYVMEKYSFPTSFKGIIEDDINDDYIKSLLENDNNYCIFHCKISTKKNHIPVRNERLMFVKGNFEGFMHQAEFKYFFDRGEVKEVDKIIMYRSDYIFKRYIDFFKKEKYRYDDNECYRQMVKTLQNALYGKLAEILRESEIMPLYDLDINSIEYYDEEGNLSHREDRFGYFSIINTIHEFDNAKTAFPCVAGAVTSYARMELARMIDEVGIDNVLYYDTDSIMTTTNINKIHLDKKEYGKWKNESIKKNGKETINVLIKGCKNYILFNDDNHILDIKIKGVKKDSKELEEDVYSTDRWWTVKTTKVKKESIFTLKHTVIMYEIKRNTLEYLKGENIFEGNYVINLDSVNMKYKQVKINPWNIKDLKKLDSLMEKDDII